MRAQRTVLHLMVAGCSLAVGAIEPGARRVKGRVAHGELAAHERGAIDFAVLLAAAHVLRLGIARR